MLSPRHSYQAPFVLVGPLPATDLVFPPPGAGEIIFGAPLPPGVGAVFFDVKLFCVSVFFKAQAPVEGETAAGVAEATAAFSAAVCWLI